MSKLKAEFPVSAPESDTQQYAAEAAAVTGIDQYKVTENSNGDGSIATFYSEDAGKLAAVVGEFAGDEDPYDFISLA